MEREGWKDEQGPPPAPTRHTQQAGRVREEWENALFWQEWGGGDWARPCWRPQRTGPRAWTGFPEKWGKVALGLAHWADGA